MYIILPVCRHHDWRPNSAWCELFTLVRVPWLIDSYYHSELIWWTTGGKEGRGGRRGGMIYFIMLFVLELEFKNPQCGVVWRGNVRVSGHHSPASVHLCQPQSCGWVVTVRVLYHHTTTPHTIPPYHNTTPHHTTPHHHTITPYHHHSTPHHTTPPIILTLQCAPTSLILESLHSLISVLSLLHNSISSAISLVISGRNVKVNPPSDVIKFQLPMRRSSELKIKFSTVAPGFNWSVFWLWPRLNPTIYSGGKIEVWGGEVVILITCLQVSQWQDDKLRYKQRDFCAGGNSGVFVR